MKFLLTLALIYFIVRYLSKSIFSGFTDGMKSSVNDDSSKTPESKKKSEGIIDASKIETIDYEDVEE